MPVSSRKFVLSVSSILPGDAEAIYSHVSKKYTLHYLNVSRSDDDDKVQLNIHFKNVVVARMVLKMMASMGIEVDEISPCKTFSGVVSSEHGTRLVHGKRKRSVESPPTSGPHTTINNTTNNNTNNIDNSTTNHNNNINLIIVNPIGQESLEHITPEFIQELLAEQHGPDVVFRFGTKMYSLTENMNFKTDVKSGYISGRLEQDGSWETHRKNEGFSMLMDNLKEKNEEAVRQHVESIPEDDLGKFDLDMHWIREHKTSGLWEDEPVYNKFVREGFNLLTANIADKKKRIERDTGKKLKLV